MAILRPQNHWTGRQRSEVNL